MPFLSLLPATARAAKPAPRPRWPPRLRPAAGGGAQARSARVRALVRALRLDAAEAGAGDGCEQGLDTGGLDTGGPRRRDALAHLGAAGAVSALRSLSVLGGSERFVDEMEALVQARLPPPSSSSMPLCQKQGASGGQPGRSARVCTAVEAGQRQPGAPAVPRRAAEAALAPAPARFPAAGG